MAIQKSRDQISLVAMDLAGLAVTSEITEHRLGNFGVGIGRESPPQHGWRDGHVEQTQPAMHGRQGLLHAVVALQRDSFESGRDGNFSMDGFLQELLVEALDRRQNRQLPLRVFYHSRSSELIPLDFGEGQTLVKTK